VVTRCAHDRDEDDCLACYAEDVREVTRERRYETLTEALDRLEAEDDDVRTASRNLDHTMWRIARSARNDRRTA
jgi:hypothetical protein